MNAVESLDDVQYELEADGELVRKQLGRQVWEERGWATVAIAYQERSAQGEWKPARVALLRFRRAHDVWKQHAVITMTGAQARAFAGAIHAWGRALETDGADTDDDE